MHLSVLAVALVSVSCLSGCSWQQVYGAAQSWQRNQCIKIMDAQEQARCMASASLSYEDYKRQTEAAKGAK